MKVHHTGCLVSELNNSIEKYHFLGFEKETEEIYDSKRKVNIVFMIKDDLRIELICPTDETSPFFELLKKKGSGPYHICFETNDFDKTKKQLIDKKNIGGGYIQITPSEPAPAINGDNVTFFYNKHVGIIEIIDRNTK
ncbi:VOC family protein [Heyndrickxia acidicola]|uniref:VOC family protein n=1 Tax=Heyndrickxia acidicola TaxID=209389 RepID=A0ABU6MK02_9BACI|nr:VOC family protein [Heyndrickxia acidicola]MED1204712.1 VOC family protein [Heyndrickxia acidicola]